MKPLPPALPEKGYKPVVIPNGGALPFKIVDGVKVLHLVAEEVDHAFDSGLRAQCWGYNGRVNSTVIEAVEGERIRIYVTNRLPAGTSVHWHGIYLPNGMDGVGGLTQPHIKPGETVKYEWTLRRRDLHVPLPPRRNDQMVWGCRPQGIGFALKTKEDSNSGGLSAGL